MSSAFRFDDLGCLDLVNYLWHTMVKGADTYAQQNLPTVMAYGEADDHLRLTVLLASLLDVPDEDAKNVCHSRSATWSQRVEALESLLKNASRRPGRVPIRMIDIDALDVQESENEAEERLDGHAFAAERMEVFRLLLQTYDPADWEIVRPNPREETTRTLTDAGVRFSSATAVVPGVISEPRLGKLVSERVSAPVHPILLSMLRRGSLAEYDAMEMLDRTTDGVDENILSMALDGLGVRGMEVALRLAVLRGPNTLNGKAGGFTILESGQEKDWLSRYDGLPRDGIQALIDGSFIDIEPTSHGDRFIMSNKVRDFLRNELELVHLDDELEAIHRWLCKDDDDPERKVEVQYHAMSTHNLDLAKQHSYYYANHLTQLGRWLSDKREYSQAASVFKFITECDAHDAYAWEYYAYNLAMSGQASSGLSGNDTHIILDAYARASNLEPENPLYRGREIGFRARMGTPIQRLFAEYVRRFQNNGRKQAGIFALHALRGIADPRERERLTIGHEWLKKNPEIKELMP